MTLHNLHDVYHDQLQDLYSGCTQSMEATTALGRAATGKELGQALIDGANGISRGIDTLEAICATHEIDPSAEHRKGMEDLVTEAHAHAIDMEISDPAVRDAVIVTQYQRMGHYALAGYGSVVAIANRLGLDGEAAKLQAMLDQTYDGDRRMTAIATSGGINKEAA